MTSDTSKDPEASAARPDYREMVTVAEARRIVLEGIGAAPGVGAGGAPVVGPEMVPLSLAAGRVLAAAVVAAEDVPGFNRSTVDGYAVRASDTFGAGEKAPVLLQVAGSVAMGQGAAVDVRPGQAAAVPTGGMLPASADAVVMVEHTVPIGPGLVEVARPVAPGENVVRVGEDVARGSAILPAGKRLTAPDLGVLAAVGVPGAACRPRPRVAIIPTGDEIVPPATPILRSGQVRDITSVAVAAYAAADGGEPAVFDIVPDRPEALDDAVGRAVSGFDLVLTLGGSSIGARDHTAAAIDKFGPPGVLFHGLSLKPGKPTIFGLCGPRRVPVFGLPGHPVSGLVVYRLLVRPVLRRLGGELLPAWAAREPALPARLSTAVSSDQGKDEYLCVRLVPAGDCIVAEPVHGKSGLITMLAKADGLVHIPLGERGLPAGAAVEVLLLD